MRSLTQPTAPDVATGAAAGDRHRIQTAAAMIALALVATPALGQRLFVGLSGSTPMTRSTDLTGFPDVQWTNHFAYDVVGAAARPDGGLYICNGEFNTKLYSVTLPGQPVFLSNVSVDIHALAYGDDTLWGYSNFAPTKGIYSIDPQTGAATLVLDVYTDHGFRFFALDYNTADGLLYGYTEYGTTGLYSIDLSNGQMTRIVGPPPAQNGQGRGMAVGNNTVYLTATRGDDGIPLYAYDLSQGLNGQWAPFTQPYPEYHSTGGAAWIPEPICDGIDRVKAKCNDAGKFTAKLKTSLNEGTSLTVDLDGQDPVQVITNRKGKAKAKWKRVDAGPHTACVRTCQNVCDEATCG